MSEVPDRETTQLDSSLPIDDGQADLGDAVEEFLDRTERTGRSPDIEAFLVEFSQCGDDLRSALEGLAVVHGLIGAGGSSRSELVARNVPSPATFLKPGNSLAGYRIVRELGRGGMGVVYEAVHVDLDRPVALKVLRDWSGGSARRRFLNEAKTAASLHHTNIVPVFDVGQAENTTYYAMQKIEGDGLDRIIRLRRGELEISRTADRQAEETHVFGSVSPASAVSRTVTDDSSDSAENSAEFETIRSNGSVSTPAVIPAPSLSMDSSSYGRDGAGFARWVARVGYQAGMALDYAHKRQVIHRDIKPSNLILDKTGTIWVTDFGLALRLDDPGLSRGDGVLGTPRYTSPEQAARKVVDYRTDIYSLGATLYELLTGRPAYDGDSSDEVIRKILTESPVPPRVLDPNVSRDLETIILKAMSARPEDRYATAGELADDLERYLRHEPVRARRIGPIGRFSRLVRRHPAVASVTLTAASIILGIATFAYRQVATERDDALAARAETLVALSGEKTALEKAKSAMRRQLWREASLVRLSAVPNRRSTILDLVKEAAGYDPEPELRSKLRNEVVEALSLRDVRAELPLSNEPVLGIEIMADQQRAVTLSEDNRTVTVWDIEKRIKRAEVQLDELFKETGPMRPGQWPDPINNQAAGPPGGSRGGPRDGPPGSFGMFSRRFARVIVSIGTTVGVVRPDGRGILWIDAETAEPRGDWSCPDGGVLLAVQAIGTEPRLLTYEYHPKPIIANGANRNMMPGIVNPNDEILVCIHDLDKPDAPPLVLDRTRIVIDRGRFARPVMSLSTDGEWVALGRSLEEDIRVLDTRTGKELGSFSAQVPVTSIAAGPYRMLAVGGGGSIRLWRHEVKQESQGSVWSATALPSVGTNLGAIRQIRFAPDSKLIAASGNTSGIELWDIDSGQAVATLATAGQVDQIAFSGSGSRLLASVDDARNGGLRVWTIEKPVAKRFVVSSPEQVLAMSLVEKDDKNTLLTQGFSGIRYLSETDMSLHKVELEAENTRYSAVRADRQGRLWMLTDRIVKRFDDWSVGKPKLSTPTEQFPIVDDAIGDWSRRGFGLTRMPSSLAFAKDSERVFMTRGSMLMMMDPAISKEFMPIHLPPPVPGPAGSFVEGSGGPRERRDGPDGRPPESGLRQGPSRDRPLSTRPSEPLAGFPVSRGPNPFSRRLSVNPNGDSFALLRGNTWEFWEIDELMVTPTGKSWKCRRLPPPSKAPIYDVSTVEISPDGRILALATRDGRIVLIDILVWQVLHEIRLDSSQEEGPNTVNDLKFMPNDPSFLAVVGQREISFWCLRTEPIHFLDLPVEMASLSPILWEPSGKGIYLVEDSRNVFYWDLDRIMTTIFDMKLR